MSGIEVASEALRTPEVLRTIFTLSNRPTCAAAALVCSVWKELAVDVLWRHLPSMLPLLELMGPLAYSGGGGWVCASLNLREILNLYKPRMCRISKILIALELTSHHSCRVCAGFKLFAIVNAKHTDRGVRIQS